MGDLEGAERKSLPTKRVKCSSPLCQNKRQDRCMDLGGGKAPRVLNVARIETIFVLSLGFQAM
ncbi:hypothetical protein HU200_016225 [Digitaria exilis]|uniref:Uncharacterized protein n=1 Tax=Digitaria exilis TaxID=1010633 RepID=A0A835F9Z4_9POAL|nr:hypothetical protein HU200_016225 [Digitaria exilis]